MYYKNIASGFILLAFLFNSCQNKQTNQTKIQKSPYCLNEDFKATIAFSIPEKQLLTESIPLTGAVEPNPDNVIHFVSLVSGIISNTYFSLGDQVNKGQILAELKSSQLLELQSQAKTIDVQIKLAEKKLQSVQSMYEDGVASQKDLMEAESELAVLNAEREKIESTLSLFSASSEKGVFLIKSPATGIVTFKSIAAGQQISAEGDPLFTISDLNEVWVMLNIYASNLRNIEPGMDVNIKTLSYPDQVFKGKISSISQVFDSENRVLKAKVVLPNFDLKLKPGMLVDVTAIKGSSIEALKLPRGALIFDNNQEFVVIYKNDCDLEIRKVSILSQNQNDVFINEGILENEKIVIKNHLLIYEQLKNFNNE